MTVVKMAHAELARPAVLADLVNWKTFAGSLPNSEIGAACEPSGKTHI